MKLVFYVLISFVLFFSGFAFAEHNGAGGHVVDVDKDTEELISVCYMQNIELFLKGQLRGTDNKGIRNKELDCKCYGDEFLNLSPVQQKQVFDSNVGILPLTVKCARPAPERSHHEIVVRMCENYNEMFRHASSKNPVKEFDCERAGEEYSKLTPEQQKQVFVKRGSGVLFFGQYKK